MTERYESLLAAYFADQLSEEEKAELLSRLDTDKELLARFREMQDAYVAACIPAFEKTKEEDYRKLQRQVPALQTKKVFKPAFWRVFAAAASVAALVSIGAALYSGHKLRDSERFIAQSEATTISCTRGTGTETVLRKLVVSAILKYLDVP